MFRARRCLLLPVALLLLDGPTLRAEDGEWALSVGPTFRGLVEATSQEDSVFRPGFGGFARLRYGIGDFFQVGGALDAGVTLPTDTSDLAPVGSLVLEIHYVIDIVTWVPFVTLGAGVLIRAERPDETGSGPSDPSVIADLLVTAGGGLEYRPARDWALGLTGRYELVVTDFAHADAFSVALVYTLFFE